MFKKVLLAGALLAPVLAYGASPSTDLSVQIVPAASPTSPSPSPPTSSNGIACDIGPNYTGTIPAGAQAAGFTHCAANYDFTQNVTFNNGNGGSGYNFATVSTWLDCAGASNPLWYVTEDGLAGGNCPGDTSQQFSIVNDGGTQVLQVQYNMPADWNNGITDAKIATASPEGWPNPPGILFPQGGYTEAVLRMPAATVDNACGSVNCILTDAWSWAPATSGNPVQEWDFIEMYGPASNIVTNGAGGGNCCGGFAEPGHTPGYDPTIYHTYAMRITMDSSGNMGVCNYLDGSQITNDSSGKPPCITGGPLSSFLQAQRHFLILEAGPQSNSYTPAQNEDLLMQRFTVWTCSSWQTTSCASSADTGSP
jgi:hypothetical protein